MTEYLMKEMSLFLMILFSFRCHDGEEAIVVRRDRFGGIVNLLPYLELLMYAKPTSFMVGSTNVYSIIFYQVYLLPWLNIPPLFLTWWCGIFVMLYLASIKTQHLYRDIPNYIVIVLMKLSRINLSDKLLTNIICIIFWSKMFLMFING